MLTNTPLYLDGLDEDLLVNNNVNEERPEEFVEAVDPEDPDPDAPIGRRNAASAIALGHQVRQQIVEELERHRQ